MENITGFIVEVTPSGAKSVKYELSSRQAVLHPGEIFLGYFVCMTGPGENNTWQYAHLTEVDLVDPAKGLFRYGGDTVFPTSEVQITIKAKRGPASNNEGLPEKFKKYPTWDAVRKG